MRVGIVNRGEVAVRIMRTCQDLGYESVLLHSTPDKNTTAYRMADETVELEGEAALDTYLNIPKVVNALKESGVDLVHPGFGFLSENSEFVRNLEEAGLKFVGPGSECIALAGNKIRVKELARKAQVPSIEAFTDQETDPKKLLNQVKKIGFPCMIKAASGGGGKGMKLVEKDVDFFELYASAKREAKSAFGNETVFIEKLVRRPRHLELQILCDGHGQTLHFFERECSIQRRHQKIIEESPAQWLAPGLRERITDSALRIAQAAHYLNAGTVEFLLDENGDFYFMELNTRLQVEHTVTEQVCGVDFVSLQFDVAQGRKLNVAQEGIAQRGHALEARIYAENPARGFLPSTGRIGVLDLPLGPHRRFDFGYEAGDWVTPHYDPMLGKVITWAPTRAENIHRMQAVLSELVIFGVDTNIEFLKSILENETFQKDALSTGFLKEEFKSGFSPAPLSQGQREFARKAQRELSGNSSSGGLRLQSPWVLP